MGRTYTLSKKEILFNDNKRIIIEEKSDDYQYAEVTYSNGKDTIYIGSYFTAYSIDKEWIEFNGEYVVIMEYIRGDRYVGPRVVRMFDMKNEQFVEGNVDELLEIYAQSFGKYLVVTTEDQSTGSELIKKYKPIKLD